ncbi:MAG: hypothetical protein ACOYD9_00650 [Pyramidobacter sp.]|jgi:hypothetical protein
MAEKAFADFTASRIRIPLSGERENATLFRARLDAVEMTQSMSQTGRCIDNGADGEERFRGIPKSEMDDLQHFDDFDSRRHRPLLNSFISTAPFDASMVSTA